MTYAYEIRYDFGPEKIILVMVSIHWQRYTSLMVQMVLMDKWMYCKIILKVYSHYE